MDSVARELERELTLDEREHEHAALLHRHQLHPVALDAIAAAGAAGNSDSPRAHLMRSPSINAVMVANGTAGTNASEDNDEEDETSALLTHHEGLLKASILEKVQSEKRLRRLSSVGDKESMNGASSCLVSTLVATYLEASVAHTLIYLPIFCVW